MTDELRRRLHAAFDGERPRPEVVDEIVQKVQACVAPRRLWHLRAAPLAAALTVPLATAGLAVAIGITHHRAGGNAGGGTAPTHAPATATPTPNPLTTLQAPAHFIPWLPLPAGGAARSTAPPGAVPPGTPACRASQLEGAPLAMGAAAGNDDLPIGLRNRDSVACVLDGYADLRIVDSGGRLLAQAVGSANRGTFFDLDSPGPVLMQPGTPRLTASPGANGSGYVGQASLNVQWVDCGHPTARTATLDLPASGGRLVVPFQVQATEDPSCFSPPYVAPWLHRGPFVAVAAEMVHYQLGARIVAPAQARAGSTLTYYVTLTNDSPVGYGFDPCPIFGEALVGSASTSKRLDTILQLNCAPAGTLAPGASLTFEMRIDVPRALSGTSQLTWDLFGLSSLPVASAAMDVLPPSG